MILFGRSVPVGILLLVQCLSLSSVAVSAASLTSAKRVARIQSHLGHLEHREALLRSKGKTQRLAKVDARIANLQTRFGKLQGQCAMLIANAVIFYNSAILSRLLTKCEARGNAKALALITQISPAAWRHILLNGHYTFQNDGKMIDLDALVAGLELGWRKFRRFWLTTLITSFCKSSRKGKRYISHRIRW